MPTHLKGLLITIAGVLVLTPDGLMVRLIAVDQWTLLFWRGILSAIGLMLILAFYYGRSTLAMFRSISRWGWLVACLFAGSTIFFLTAMAHTSVANTFVIISAAPLFAAVFSFVLMGELVARRTWVAIVIALGSIALIFSHSVVGGTLIGDLAAVGTAACIASTFVVMRRERNVNMIPAMVLSGVLSALVALALAAPLVVQAQSMNLIVLLCLCILPVAYALITLGPRYLPAPEVSLILLLETVLGPFWVWLVLDEQPSWQAIVGGGILVSTLFVHSLLTLRYINSDAEVERGKL